MEAFLAKIVESLRGVDFEGPAMFVVVFLAFLALFRRWSILLMTLLVIVLGWGAQDLMIMNIETGHNVVSLPLLIYSTGGVIIVILCLWSFYKS